jgi:hypothetical protein
LGADEIVPARGLSAFLAKGQGQANEPRNATLVTSVIAIVFVVVGDVDLVARVV